MINSVNFGKLDDALIKKPQANSIDPTSTTTSASTNVKGDSFEKKGKGGKVVLGVLATIAAALTTLALLVKKEKLNPIVVENGKKLKLTERAINIAHAIGNETLNIARLCIKGVKKLYDGVKKLFTSKKTEDSVNTGGKDLT